jgi:hypothetical protein
MRHIRNLLNMLAAFFPLPVRGGHHCLTSKQAGQPSCCGAHCRRAACASPVTTCGVVGAAGASDLHSTLSGVASLGCDSDACTWQGDTLPGHPAWPQQSARRSCMN